MIDQLNVINDINDEWDSKLLSCIKQNDLEYRILESFLILVKNARRLELKKGSFNQKNALRALGLMFADDVSRAAYLLFNKSPDNYYPGTFIKIGYFANDSELLFQDEIKGCLFAQAEKAMKLIFNKYLKVNSMSDDESDALPPIEREAIQEAIHNAIIHKDYSRQIPIQIRVYSNKIMISNPCELPIDINEEKFINRKMSLPHNRLISSAFYYAGKVDLWGMGIEKISNRSIHYGCKRVEYKVQSDSICLEIEWE